MWFLESSLRQKYPRDRLHILVAKANSGNFTYDGIELGAERVTQEIEAFLDDLQQKEEHIDKFSIVGYSLGGLVARYVIGLLYSKGRFSEIRPINFTTFATPHLGVRTPLIGARGRFWNLLGSRTLSTSGRQLFIVDSFRNTNRPILAVLADPNSIFIQALSSFKHRVLYANIINDRSAPFYTTYISTNDPFTRLDALQINYLPSYCPNIVHPAKPFHAKDIDPSSLLFSTRLLKTSQSIVNGLPLAALLSILIPIGTVVFLVNSSIQSIRSQQRIRLHESGKAGIALSAYRTPLIGESAPKFVKGAFETGNSREEPDYLPDISVEQASVASDEKYQHKSSDGTDKDLPSREAGILSANQALLSHEFPTLALTSAQFEMIDSLNDIGFRKYMVHIHKVRHSHAAIIRRRNAKGHEEGNVVVRHWLQEEFEI